MGFQFEFDFSWPVFRQFAFYSSILMFKITFLSFWRAALQYQKRIVFEKEDLYLFRHFRMTIFDEDIHRTEKAQDDDLKTIIPFCILGLIYCFTHPSVQYARALFQIFTLARYLHTVVYVIYIVRQPARAIAWSIGTVINMYMCFKILFYFL